MSQKSIRETLKNSLRQQLSSVSISKRETTGLHISCAERVPHKHTWGAGRTGGCAAS